jgi:hypothetical protein
VRAAGKYAEVLALDHYLEVLKYTPGALPDAAGLVQAKPQAHSPAFTSSTGMLPAGPAATPAEPGH